MKTALITLTDGATLQIQNIEAVRVVDEFNWDRFIAGKIAVQTRTHEYAENFITAAETHGILLQNLWQIFGTDLAYTKDGRRGLPYLLLGDHIPIVDWQNYIID